MSISPYRLFVTHNPHFHFSLPTSILDLIEHNICSHGEGGDTSPKRGMTREALAGTQVE